MFTYETYISIFQILICISSIVALYGGYKLKNNENENKKFYFVLLPGGLVIIFSYFIYVFSNKLEEIKLTGNVNSRTIYNNRNKPENIFSEELFENENPDNLIAI